VCVCGVCGVCVCVCVCVVCVCVCVVCVTYYETSDDYSILDCESCKSLKE